MATVEFERAQLFALAKHIFEGAGVCGADAEVTADNLISADVCGLSSHGLMRVTPYVRRIRAGLTNPKPQIRHEQISDHMFKVHGDGALGQVGATYAMNLCMESALRTGSAIVVVNHINHIGMAGYYTKQAARKGLLAFMCTNASPTMAPFGGVDRLLGTNPFCVSFPAGKYQDFTLDVATTATARGKIRMYQKENRPIPLGWATDAQGNDTTDPAAALAGTLLPMGGHKGYGLAMIVDALSGILAGADLSCEAEGMFEATTPANTGCYISVVDIRRFLPLDGFTERSEQWLDRIKNSHVKPGVQEILIPGEIENRRAAQADGKVPLLEQTYEELTALDQQIQAGE